MNQYRHLSAFPENRGVLTELKQRGVPAGILSNGDPAMLAVAVKSAGFTDLLQHLLSVDGVRRFKTDPAAYALGPQALGLPARDILFVSSNGWDAIGATWYRLHHAVGQPRPARRWNSWAPNPAAPAAACATCSTFS
jgi:2-haloacid dehalogenase